MGTGGAQPFRQVSGLLYGEGKKYNLCSGHFALRDHSLPEFRVQTVENQTTDTGPTRSCGMIALDRQDQSPAALSQHA